MFSTRIKIVVGYVLLAVVLLSSTWMIYDNTRSLAAVNRASERLLARRDVVDSLVCSMLETANAERSVLLGDADEWKRFESALDTSAEKARRLRPMLSDKTKQQRLDSLVTLLDAKRRNTLLVLAEIGKNSSDLYYSQKVHALQTGRDSIVIHPVTEEKHEQHETVYEVVKSRRGFFRRLGDAFRRQHTDTVSTTHIAKQPSKDTVDHRLNIADSVANVLAQIRNEQQRATNRQQNIIASQGNRLQWVSIQLARRTGMLLEDIQSDEHNALKQAIGKAIQSRHEMMIRIGLLGILAILSAAILVVYILRDIRRERRDRDRIVAAKAATESIMQQRERLLLTITHDIKAPAASIAGFIDLLGEYVDQPKAVGYLESISGSARHMLLLVSALLDYHQLENGKAELHEESFAPAKLVGECVAEMQPMAMEKGLGLRVDIQVPDTVVCRSDAFRIKQVVNNLVGNAIKYTDTGSVTVALAVVDGRMTVSVTDTGCGMTDDEQQRVFNAFTRLPNAQGKEGVGLGLSIAREIVDRLGGNIRLASKKGRGTKFTVNIPVATACVEAVAQDTAMVETDKKHSAGSVDTSCLTVLVVDDDRLQLQLLAEMFGRIEGLELSVFTTSHAKEAIKLAHDKNPNIVFTDIEMPEMNGSDILRSILAGCDEERKKNLKFVAMTAHEQSIMPQLRGEGFDACLFKPFTVQTLAATVCQLYGRLVKVKAGSCQPKDDKRVPEDRLHEVLLQFTDGDVEAERQIISDVHRSIDEYLSMLVNPSDAASVAKAAHKAMPLLEMLQPGKNGWLSAITPEHIGDTTADERDMLVTRLKAELNVYSSSTPLSER